MTVDMKAEHDQMEREAKRRMTTAQVADHLCVSVRTLECWRGKKFGPPWHRWCARGRIYFRDEVDTWLAARGIDTELAGSELLTTREAAGDLGVSIRTLENMRARATGPKYIRMGPKKIFYLHAALELWRALHQEK
jgi:hypothetical protein